MLHTGSRGLHLNDRYVGGLFGFLAVVLRKVDCGTSEDDVFLVFSKVNFKRDPSCEIENFRRG